MNSMKNSQSLFFTIVSTSTLSGLDFLDLTRGSC